MIVIRYAGPRGYPGMPEIANVALPKRLLQQGVRDMVRISDARMSGTSYGTVILHVAPEAAVGGPLALVRDGDVIVPRRPRAPARHRGRRRGARTAARGVGTAAGRGHRTRLPEALCRPREGADVGADFDFLRGCSGADVPRQAF